MNKHSLGVWACCLAVELSVSFVFADEDDIDFWDKDVSEISEEEPLKLIPDPSLRIMTMGDLDDDEPEEEIPHPHQERDLAETFWNLLNHLQIILDGDDNNILVVPPFQYLDSLIGIDYLENEHYAQLQRPVALTDVDQYLTLAYGYPGYAPNGRAETLIDLQGAPVPDEDADSEASTLHIQVDLACEFIERLAAVVLEHCIVAYLRQNQAEEPPRDGLIQRFLQGVYDYGYILGEQFNIEDGQALTAQEYLMRGYYSALMAVVEGFLEQRQMPSTMDEVERILDRDSIEEMMPTYAQLYLYHHSYATAWINTAICLVLQIGVVYQQK